MLGEQVPSANLRSLVIRIVAQWLQGQGKRQQRQQQGGGAAGNWVQEHPVMRCAVSLVELLARLGVGEDRPRRCMAGEQFRVRQVQGLGCRARAGVGGLCPPTLGVWGARSGV